MLGVIAQGQPFPEGNGQGWITQGRDQPQAPDEDGTAAEGKPRKGSNIGTGLVCGSYFFYVIRQLPRRIDDWGVRYARLGAPSQRPPEKHKPGSQGLLCSFGSPAVSDGLGEIRNFPHMPHGMIGFSGTSMIAWVAYSPLRPPSWLGFDRLATECGLKWWHYLPL